MYYKNVIVMISEKQKSRETCVNPGFRENGWHEVSKILRTFNSVKIYDHY